MPGLEPVIKPNLPVNQTEPAECFSLPFSGRQSSVTFNIRAPLATDELRVIFESCLACMPENELTQAVLPPLSFLEKHFYAHQGDPGAKAASGLKSPEALLDLSKSILPALNPDYPARVKLLAAMKAPLEQIWPAVQKACAEGWFKLSPAVNIMPVSFGWGGTFETDYPERGMIWVKAEDNPSVSKAEEITLTALHLLIQLGVHEELSLKNCLTHQESREMVNFLCSHYFKIPGYPAVKASTQTESAMAAWIEETASWRSRFFSPKSPGLFLAQRGKY